MREIVNDRSFKLANICAYLSKNWVDEYMTELEVQGCTRLDCNGRIFMDTSSNVKLCENKNVFIWNSSDPSNMHSSTWDS